MIYIQVVVLSLVRYSLIGMAHSGSFSMHMQCSEDTRSPQDWFLPSVQQLQDIPPIQFPDAAGGLVPYSAADSSNLSPHLPLIAHPDPCQITQPSPRSPDHSPRPCMAEITMEMANLSPPHDPSDPDSISPRTLRYGHNYNAFWREIRVLLRKHNQQDALDRYKEEIGCAGKKICMKGCVPVKLLIFSWLIYFQVSCFLQHERRRLDATLQRR